MIGLLWSILAILISPCRSNARLEAANAVLRHQLLVLRRKCRGRVRLTNFDRWIFVQLYRLFPSILVSLLYWGGLLSSAFRLFSIDPVVMSVAGSALLYWGCLLSSAFRLFSIDPGVMSGAGSAFVVGIGTSLLGRVVVKRFQTLLHR